jgi:uncharacterized repeat protein (TIGR03803 family)
MQRINNLASPLTVLSALLLLAFSQVAARAQPAAIQLLYTVTASSNNPYGAPNANLASSPDGNLYGTSYNGGSYGAGSAFELTTNGVCTTLVSFSQTGLGTRPIGLTLGTDGNFYGTTSWSEGTLDGTLFKMTTNGGLTFLAEFNGTNGWAPNADLALGPGGALYGTTRNGGREFVIYEGGYGTVFKLSTNGILTSLLSFSEANGNSPTTGLTLGSDGNFYGTTAAGGRGGGTLFKITPNGDLTYLVSFDGTNGGVPNQRLTLGTDGSLYGTTFGTFNGGGTVFKLKSDGSLAYVPWPTLPDPSGLASITSALTFGSDGNLYGICGHGTIFQVTTNLDVTAIASSSDTSAGPQFVNLVLAGDGNLYGGYTTKPSGGLVVSFFRLYLGPIVTTQPASQSLPIGGDVTLDIALNGAPPFSCQWLFDGIRLAGATNLSLCLTNLRRGDAGGYSVAVTNVFGAATSSVAVLTIGAGPNITSQPQSLTNGVGTSAAFAVTATGDVPLGYLWRKNGEPISGATNLSYSISSVTASDSGGYDVVVTNLYGSATSRVGTLTVVVPGLAWRTLPATFQPGETITVRLDVTPPAGTTNWSITDHYPGNWLFAGSTNPASADDYSAQVVLGPYTDSQPRTLAYQVTSVFESDNVAVFSGYLADSVLATNAPVLGDSNTLAVRQWEFVGPQVLTAQDVCGAAYGAGRWVATSLGWATSLADGATYWSYPKALASYKPGFSRMAFLGGRFLWWGEGYTSDPRMAASEDGLVWRLGRGQPGSPAPDPFQPAGWIQSAAYGGGVYIAVGFHWTNAASLNGTIWYSTNGYDWSEVYKLQMLNPNRDLWSVAYGASNFIAVGDSGTVVSSMDGLSWTETQDPLNAGTNNPLSSRSLQGIGYGPGGWIVTMNGNSPVQTMFSPDGTNWSLRSANISPHSYYSFFADGQYWFTEQSDSYVTTDGVSWSDVGKACVRRAPDGVTPKFLSGGQAGAIYGSEDGTNWTLLLAAPGNSGGWPSVQTAIGLSSEWLVGGLECSIGSSIGTWAAPVENPAAGNVLPPQVGNPASWFSDSTVNWSQAALPVLADVRATKSGVFGAGLANGANLTAGPVLPDHSLGGMNLEASSRNVNAVRYYGTPAYWGWVRASLCLATNQFELYAEAGNIAAPYPYGSGVSTITWGHFTSPDGTNWSLRTPGLNDATNFAGIRGLAYGAGRYVAVGEGGNIDLPYTGNRIFTSINGNNYTAVDVSSLNPPLTESLENVAYAGGVFVAVGQQGTILQSADGLNWKIAYQSDGLGWNRVRYLNSAWSLVGDAGRVATSPDGLSWVVKSTGVTNRLRDIALLGGYYLVVGDGGMVLRSTFRVHQPPRVLTESLVRLVNGSFQFTVQTDPNVLPSVEASSDLVNWAAITPTHSVPDATGFVTFSDADAANHNHRFYRARLP